MSTGASQLVSFIGSTYGSLFFAALISTALYGIACLQTFSYYVDYQDDSMGTKIFIAVLWALNSVHEALTVAGTYKFIMGGLDRGRSSVSLSVTGNPELLSLYLLTALVAVPTQGFFIYRLYIFSGRNIAVPLTWAVLALAQLVSPIVYIAIGSPIAKAAGFNSSVFAHSAKIIPTLCFALPTGVDILIAVFMTLLLHRERVAANFASTSHLLQRLVVFAVHTGTWTATFALLSVILLHAFPLGTLYAVFAIPICSVYYNTILANLNARTYLMGEEKRARTNLLTTTSFQVANVTATATTDKQPESTQSGGALSQGLAEAEEGKKIGFEPPSAAETTGGSETAVTRT